MKRTLPALILAAAALTGCSRPPLGGPPELRPGREECAECGMLVSEDRSACAALIERDRERLYAFFDDIGCMLDYERAGAGEAEILERYVHDYAARGWLDARAAVYLFAGPGAIQTPMGSGIAAFATADAARAQAPGELMDLESLRAARRGWMDERSGSPAAAPTP